jgi:hypothetical protein
LEDSEKDRHGERGVLWTLLDVDFFFGIKRTDTAWCVSRATLAPLNAFKNESIKRISIVSNTCYFR